MKIEPPRVLVAFLGDQNLCPLRHLDALFGSFVPESAFQHVR